MTFATCSKMMNLTDILLNKINENEKSTRPVIPFK